VSDAPVPVSPNVDGGLAVLESLPGVRVEHERAVPPAAAQPAAFEGCVERAPHAVLSFELFFFAVRDAVRGVAGDGLGDGGDEEEHGEAEEEPELEVDERTAGHGVTTSTVM
jgi:hypothetical protein